MEFNKLPPEMIQYVLKFVGNKDLLRFRRAAFPDVNPDYRGRHPLKDNVNHLLQNKAICSKTYFIGLDADVVEPQTVENNWDHIRYMTMDDFLALELPMLPRRFSFNFTTEDNLFADEEWRVVRFLRRYGDYLTHLTMSELWLPMLEPRAKTFFNTVAPSLRYLSIDTLQLFNFEEGEERKLPPFHNLTTLKINRLEVEWANQVQDLEYFWNVVRTCTNLEELTLPDSVAGDDMNENQGGLDLGYHHLANLLDQGFLRHLKFCDLKNVIWFNANLAGAGTFVRFCQSMRAHDKMLENVHCLSFQRITIPVDLEIIGSVVFSMKEYNLSLGPIQFPKLEQIDILTAMSIGGDDNDAVYLVPSWPSLKSLKLTVNCNFLNDGVDTRLLFQVLFVQALRPSVEILHLCGPGFRHCWEIPLPAFVNIARSCHNVTRITIQNWEAEDEDYVHLWRGLGRLQSITIEDCPTVGIDAFTGWGETKPAFLELKSLEKLQLIRVQNMPNIRDDLFQLIIRHLPLKEFIINSYESDLFNQLANITSFTQNGILALTTSKFKDSIERFPFKCFKLVGLDRTAMNHLGERFRSSSMM